MTLASPAPWALEASFAGCGERTQMSEEGVFARDGLQIGEFHR
jgi:hypothetical protein